MAFGVGWVGVHLIEIDLVDRVTTSCKGGSVSGGIGRRVPNRWLKLAERRGDVRCHSNHKSTCESLVQFNGEPANGRLLRPVRTIMVPNRGTVQQPRRQRRCRRPHCQRGHVGRLFPPLVKDGAIRSFDHHPGDRYQRDDFVEHLLSEANIVLCQSFVRQPVPAIEYRWRSLPDPTSAVRGAYRRQPS